MVKRYRYKKGRMATQSTVPSIYALRETVEMMNMLSQKMPGRLVRGRQLFLLAVADFVMKSVKQRAPDIEMGNEKFPYSEHLKLGIVDGSSSDMDAVAIYFDNKRVVLDKSKTEGRALYFQPTDRSPDWVNVLMVYGPWPSHMVPVPMAESRSRVISRDARPDELKALSDRIYVSRGKIEQDLRRAGAANISIGETSNAVGVVVNEDVGYNILRKEFGHDGTRQMAHWRPTLAAIKDEMPGLMGKYLRYLKTGHESVFELPKDIDNVKASKMDKGAGFAKALAPFAPRG